MGSNPAFSVKNTLSDFLTWCHSSLPQISPEIPPWRAAGADSHLSEQTGMAFIPSCHFCRKLLAGCRIKTPPSSQSCSLRTAFPAANVF